MLSQQLVTPSANKYWVANIINTYKMEHIVEKFLQAANLQIVRNTSLTLTSRFPIEQIF